VKARGVETRDAFNVEHHFWSKTQRDAALLANELYKRGFLLLVLAPATRASSSEYAWNVEAGTKDSIDHAASDDVASELVDLATLFNSRYDGWGTTIETNGIGKLGSHLASQLM
jgi:regulator of RNase E activity RraB